MINTEAAGFSSADSPLYYITTPQVCGCGRACHVFPSSAPFQTCELTIFYSNGNHWHSLSNVLYSNFRCFSQWNSEVLNAMCIMTWPPVSQLKGNVTWRPSWCLETNKNHESWKRWKSDPAGMNSIIKF